MEDDFFEENDAIDYILYEETEKEVGTKNGNSGCFGTILLIISTFGGVAISTFMRIVS
jgi:hypothetical protein